MLEDGLSYPMRGDWIGRVLIGSVLMFFSWLFVPIILLMGYFVRVLEETIAGNEEPPEFTDWGELLIKGAIASVIGFVYSAVPLLIYAIFAVVVFGVGGLFGGAEGGLTGLLLGLLVIMLTFIPVVMLIYYIVPAALTNYARTGEIGSAFRFGEIAPVLLSVEYLIAVLVPLAIAFATSIAVSILFATVIGAVLVPVVYFYAQVVIFRMFGSAFISVSDTASSSADSSLHSA